MADKSFGVKELNLLNASGTPTVTSPNNLNLNANTVAISTSCTIGNNLTVTGGTTLTNLNATGISTLRATTFLAGNTVDVRGNFTVSGISTIPQPADSNPMANWTITNNSASAYRFTGPGQSGTEDNPNIYLVRGHRYIFEHNATSSHPIQIRFANGGTAYTDGITYSEGNNTTTDGNNLIFNVQHDAPAQLFYQCTAHGGMVGNIYIVGGPQVISGVVTATTFVGNLTGNVTGTASANAVLTGSTNNQLVTVTGANAITGESNLTWDGSAMAVGHSNPSDTLHVYHATDNLVARFESGDTGGGITLKDNTHVTSLLTTNGAFEINVDQGGDISGETIAFKMSGSEKLRITSGGSVNIGDDFSQTTYKTQIESTDQNVLRLVTDSDNADGVELILRKDSASPADNDNIGNIYFQGNDDSGAATFYASMEAYSSDVSNNSEDGYIRFRTRNNGSMGERLRINSVGDLLLGAHGSRIFDDSSGTNVVVDIYGGATAGKRGILALGGRTGSDNADIGTIQFLNENNGNATAANHVQSKLVASIDVKSETTTNNASANSGGHLIFSTKAENAAVTERLRIDSSGIITKPYQPAFLAHNNASYASNATISSGSVIDFFRSTKFNRGNHYDTSNGYFVAPVSGVYYFNAALSIRSGNTGIQIGYTVNSTSASGLYYGGTDVLVFEAHISGISAAHPNGAMLMDLSAGDIVRLYNRSAAFTCGRHHSWWMGYLIG